MLWNQQLNIPSKVDLPVHEIDEEHMLKILANENVETEEDRTAYPIDTVLAVKKLGGIYTD